MKRYCWIWMLVCVVYVHAQEVDSVQTNVASDTIVSVPKKVNNDSAVVVRKGYAQIRSVRAKIDSMHYVVQGYRDSMRYEIRSYKDSLRETRRHAYDAMPHTLRVGWGDQLFETMVWHNTGYYTGMPESYQEVYAENYRYTQHYFVEYMYSVNYWYSFGLLVDYSGVIWDQVLRNGKGKELNRLKDRAFHNIAIVPTINFSYFHHDYVSLYSALGVGVNVNTGTELDCHGRQSVASPVVNITLMGLRVGKGRWYGAIEVGGMISLNGKDELYMLGSRLFTASIAVRL